MKPGEKVKLRANLPQHKVEEMMEAGIVPGREYYVTHVHWVDGVDFIRLNGRDLMVGAKWFVPVNNAVEWKKYESIEDVKIGDHVTTRRGTIGVVLRKDGDGFAEIRTEFGSRLYAHVSEITPIPMTYKKPIEEDTAVNIFDKIDQLFNDALSKLDDDTGVWDFTNPALCSEQKFRESNIFSTDEQWAESQKKWDRLEKFLDSEDARDFYRDFDFDNPKEPLVTLGKDQLIALMVAFKKATRHKDGRPLHVDPEE